MERPSILDRLRSETRSQHLAIEAELDWERRFSTIRGYRDHLARMHGFHVAWEPVMAQAVADPEFFEPRRKKALIEADLGHLGLDPYELSCLPKAPISPAWTVAEALGAMYVVEGSTLGGQVIARRVMATHGLDRGRGCSYHLAYGASAGAMWRAFRQRLLAVSGPNTDEVMIRAADRTFSDMRAWLAHA